MRKRPFGGGGGGAAASSSGLIQRQHASTATAASTATTLPFDDTIPQNTEGAEILTLAITPNDTANRLYIHFNGMFSSDNGAGGAEVVTIALFQDSTAAALCAFAGTGGDDNNRHTTLTLCYEMAAGTVSETTFKIRFGPAAATTAYFGRQDTPTRFFGGLPFGCLTIDEYANPS